MERLIAMLNLMSASILVATGGYMQVTFVDLLSEWVRLAIVAGVLVNFFITLLRLMLVVLHDEPVAVAPVSGGNIA